MALAFLPQLEFNSALCSASRTDRRRRYAIKSKNSVQQPQLRDCLDQVIVEESVNCRRLANKMLKLGLLLLISVAWGTGNAVSQKVSTNEVGSTSRRSIFSGVLGKRAEPFAIPIEALLQQQEDPKLIDGMKEVATFRPKNKRAMYSGLLGKRAMYSGLLGKRAMYSGLLGKRAMYSGLLGKRAMYSGLLGKRDMYSGLLGKRDMYSGLLGKRAMYSGLLGKRAMYSGLLGKRAMYSGLLGKRAMYSGLLGKRDMYSGLLGKRAMYSGLLGKRAMYSGLLGKRAMYSGLLGKRAMYSGLLGKRSKSYASDEEDKMKD